ncbi:MAG: hypothetical protein EXS09_01725 [Gemmataceae bacterium]|nr:hypothetical protein [Gemmataceae bacterium]
MRIHPLAFRRLIVLAGAGAVLAAFSHAQEPKTLPPSLLMPPAGPPSKGVIPASSVVSPAETVATKAALFDRFRKYDQLPDLTRELVFATKSGMEWLGRDGIHQANGRFIPGLSPALGKATEDDHFMRQALGAFALARSARLTGEEKYTVRASQTILSLLAEAPKDSAGIRKLALASVVCNRVGGAAYLALAIFELPEAAPELRQCGEELCQFLRSRVQADGSISFAEEGEAPEADGVGLYAGPALTAIAMSNRESPAEWKKQALAKSLKHYRQQFSTLPNPMMISWMCPAFVEMHLQTREPAAAEFVFEMCDWLVKLQFESPDRQRATWRGGFPQVAGGKILSAAPTIETAYYAMAIADACRMIRTMEKPDSARYDRYRATLTRALQFLTTLQYGEENTGHFAAHFRPALVGAFHPSHTDGSLRVDHSAVAVAAFSQYLIAGVDR